MLSICPGPSARPRSPLPPHAKRAAGWIHPHRGARALGSGCGSTGLHSQANWARQSEWHFKRNPEAAPRLSRDGCMMGTGMVTCDQEFAKPSPDGP